MGTAVLTSELLQFMSDGHDSSYTICRGSPFRASLYSDFLIDQRKYLSIVKLSFPQSKNSSSDFRRNMSSNCRGMLQLCSIWQLAIEKASILESSWETPIACWCEQIPTQQIRKHLTLQCSTKLLENLVEDFETHQKYVAIAGMPDHHINSTSHHHDCHLLARFQLASSCEVPQAIHFQSTCTNRVDFRRLHQTCNQKFRQGSLPIETSCRGYICAHYTWVFGSMLGNTFGATYRQ